MKIATWNINGIKARLETAVRWLADARPDVVCLQEIKSTEEGFPAATVEDLGYNIALSGQKGLNGVAILSRRPLEDVSRGLPGDDEDDHARFIEATISTTSGAIRVVSLYLPNGNPIGTAKFDYKLKWMERLERWTAERLKLEEMLVLAGDFNVIPEPVDARNPAYWSRDALYQPESRMAFRRLVNLGLTEAVRTATPSGGHYTFWDYQAGGWQKDNGIRIDHFLLSPQAADRFIAVSIDKRTRAWDKPSDHVPVILEMAETAAPGIRPLVLAPPA